MLLKISFIIATINLFFIVYIKNKKAKKINIFSLIFNIIFIFLYKYNENKNIFIQNLKLLIVTFTIIILILFVDAFIEKQIEKRKINKKNKRSDVKNGYK